MLLRHAMTHDITPTAAAAVAAGTCPPAPKEVHTYGVHRAVNFTLTPGSCISGVACTATHCSCDNQHLINGTCSSAADCVAKAQLQCLGDPACHLFAFEGSCNKTAAQ